MSAVAGVALLSGGHVSIHDLEPVVESLRARGAAFATEKTDGACFGRSSESQVFLSASPGSGSVLISAAARLDNREELADSLGVSSRDPRFLPDDHLVVKAFERWGEACLNHLSGDWCLAAWSASSRRLFLARDHFGNTALYFARIGERVGFSSSLASLLALPWLPRRLNEVYLASLMTGEPGAPPASTAYLEISRLPPAHAVTIEGDQQRLVRYWRVEATPDAGPAPIAQQTEVLRETLRAAVRSRLPAKVRVGSMLSGGIDSGAVTAFAAQELHGQNRRLTAFTSVPAFATGASRRSLVSVNEGPSAAALANAFAAIDHVLVSADGVSPLAGARRGLALLGEPLGASGNYGWITALMAEAQARGITVLLTGQIGDFVMAGRPPEASWHRDLLTGRYRALAKRVAPSWLRRLQRAGWNPRRLKENPWRRFSVVNTQFAVDVLGGQRMLDRDQDSGPDSWIVSRATSYFGAIWQALGAAYGLRVLDPLQDRRVMELMFSRPRPAGHEMADRWLFRQALTGVLPEPVRLSRRKHIQSADLVERLTASWAEVEDALAAAEASPLARRCLDLPYCRELAASLLTDQSADRARQRAFVLIQGLMMAQFLADES
jgi:asparagine synthase (glutamine-hydrolysing)